MNEQEMRYVYYRGIEDALKMMRQKLYEGISLEDSLECLECVIKEQIKQELNA